MRKSREQRAKELLEMVELGPAFVDPARLDAIFDDPRAGIPYQYRHWAGSRLIPRLCDLIPELRSVVLADGK
jgi:hypothetical protein